MVDENTTPLTINSAKYNQYANTGTSFTLNKLSFHWKELQKFEGLTALLADRKYQKNYSINENYKKPTIVKTSNEGDISGNIITMSVCIPCYDEEWCELSGTLRSLSKNILIHRKRSDSTFKLHVTVFIIQDGWNKSSESLKEGILREWGCPTKKLITQIMDKKLDSVCIIIPDYEIYYPSYDSSIAEEQIGVCVYPIFITKSKNSQKFNSHLLFFSLCFLQKPDCVFLTDTGTIYNSDCLYKLTDYLVKNHSNVIGVTARQSIMTEKVRTEITEYPNWWHKKQNISTLVRFFNHIYWWISPAPLQGFEFESTFLLSTAIFNLFGALAVLPGPCQLLWWDHLETNKKNDYGVLDLYFKHLNMNINTSGIIKTNTLLAEDRVLSFSMILRTNNMKTIWVNGAGFAYEPLLSWVKLLGQRRRWLNGTISIYLYYLFDSKGSDEVMMSGIGNNTFLVLLWYLQVYQSFLQILSPSFFSIALYESMMQTVKNHPTLDMIDFKNFKLDILVTFSYFLFYVLCIIISITLGKKMEYFCCYDICMECTYYLIGLINSCISIFILYNIILSAMHDMFTGIVFYILLFAWMVPLLLSITLSTRSTFYYILYTIPFLCQITQYVSFIPTYAFARLHDLSWGNRDSTTSVSINTYRSFLFSTLKVNIVSILCNFSIISLYIFLYYRYGHSYYISIPFMALLFLSLIVQLCFALIYLSKICIYGVEKKDTNTNFSSITEFDTCQSVDI